MKTYTAEDILSEVIRLIELTLKVPADQVDIDANFETFGINSLIVMELMENIEKEFDVTLTPAQFSNVDTVRSLAVLLEGLLGEKAAESGGAQAPSPVVAPMQAAAIAAPTAQASFAPTQGPQPSSLHQATLSFIRDRYGIELPGGGYASMHDIVDRLVLDHTGELLRHFGIAVADDGNGGARRRDAVAIVGISCRLPDAPDHRAFWANLVDGRDSMREIPAERWDWQQHYAEKVEPGKTIARWGALIDDVDRFDAGFFAIPAEEAASMDPQQRLLLQETYRAVEDAGIDMKSLAGSRTGVFVGYEYSEYEHHLRQLNNKDFTKGPLFSSSSPSYYLSNRISFVFDLCGPSESYNVNCASSAVAINRAFHSLLDGESDIAIAGAVSLNLFEGDYIASSQYGVLSADGSSRVFDDDANGFTRGEGVAAVVFKRLSDAERDNDRIYAIVRGVHQTYRGAARNISEVKHEAISRVLSECYERTGVPASSVRYIEVDGYATKWADSFEYEGVKGAFANAGIDGKRVALGSLKANIGNVESVSGIANVIKLAMSMHHGRIPRTISVGKVNTFMDVASQKHPLYIADHDIVLDEIRDGEGVPVLAGINSFADSGSNVHILLEEYLSRKPAAAEDRAKQLFLLSAKSSERLLDSVRRHIDFLANAGEGASLASLACTSQCGREAMTERLAISAASVSELREKLEVVERAGVREKLGLEGRGIFRGRFEAADKQSIASLITAEMSEGQLMRSKASGDWKPIGMLWVNGANIPWAGLWRGTGVAKAGLPGYPFARDRYWIDVQATADRQATGVATIRVPEAVQMQPQAATADTGATAQGPVERQWHFYVPADPAHVPAGARSLSPTAKIELFLRQETALRMGVAIEQVAIDQDFIQLGLDSMAIADLFIRTDALLETNLSPSVLFKNPEIGSLAMYLGEVHAEQLDAIVVAPDAPEPGAVKAAGEVRVAPNHAVQPVDILVPLQTKGSQSPIFAVPGAGGGALSLQPLAQALGGEQPLYCLEAVGLDGSTEPHASVEDIAAFNLRALREVRAEGPYRLLGYSNGGIVAFEMARQLSQAGEKVELALLDTLSPAIEGKDADVEMAEVFNHFVSSIGGSATIDAKTLAAIPEGERAKHLHRIVAEAGLEVPERQFVATFDAAGASERVCRDYRPSEVDANVDVVLFRATRGYPGAPRDYGWSGHVKGGFQIHDVDATHFEVLAHEGVSVIARTLGAEGKAKNGKRGRKQAPATAGAA